jgi:hypothetical protein
MIPVRTATPSRRGLLAAAAAALAAGAAIATAAHGTPVALPGADAELIRLCKRLVEIEAAEAVIFDTFEDEDDATAQDRALAPLQAEWQAIEDRLYELDNPTTPEGVHAVAVAAIATAPKLADGQIGNWSFGLSEYLAFAAVEWLAGRAA